MALELVATRRARRDVEEILAYIAADNPAAAQALQGRIDKALRLLCERPFIGAVAAGFADETLRKFSISPYVVFYVPRDGKLAIVRVIHSSMDMARQQMPGLPL
ncbi:hypothetical protein ATER59S_04382 [Aquamicrobium terrae]|uniref:type II toxin-antitoxin system RelE/ParE family toxin n=1 Tax=Mesorhizobium sp. PUT5 TaxID=3454629 RepID=UPI003FA42015